MEMLETIFPIEHSNCSSQHNRILGEGFPTNGTFPCRSNYSHAERALLDTHPELAIPYIVILSSAVLIGTTGNGLILQHTCSPKGMKIGKEFIINLAVSDLFISTVAHPFCIISAVKGKQFFEETPFLCEFVASVCLTACIVSLFNMTLIAVNRYVFVCHHKFHDILFRRKTCIIICILIWPLAFLLEMPNHVGWGDHMFDTKNHACIWDRKKSFSYTLFLTVGLIAAPIVVMSVLYMLVIRHIWISKKPIFSFDPNNPHIRKDAKAETVRASKTLIATFGVFMICWLPYTFVVALDVNDEFPMWLHLYSTLLAHLHAIANSVVYVAFSCRCVFKPIRRIAPVDPLNT